MKQEIDAFCMAMTTCPDREEAARLAGILVEQRLAACVQLVEINSYYRWQDSVHNDPEILLLMKTRTERYDALEACVRENHGYDVPEIIMLSIRNGFAPYLAWIDEETSET